MALTKVTKSGITDNSIDADKLEDGTIVAADIATGTITADKLNSTLDLSSKTVTLPNTSVSNAMLAGSIANAKLANSTLTINGSSISLGGSVNAGTLDWQTVIVADGSTSTTGVAGRGYFINTTSAAHTFTLPISATRGDTIAIVDYAETFATNKLTIARNGHNIQGVANDSLIGTNRASITLVYVDSTKGWVYQDESNVADLQVPPQFVAATGGTVTTSGDFKIHTFTGDGSFVVSNAGFITPAGGSTTVDYLVVAGGGGGGANSGGGGGAGGFRISNSYILPAPTISPLASPTGLNVSVTTYPVTVGGGGNAPVNSFPNPSTKGGNGNNSIFSTITSTGGGGGSAASEGGSVGGSGGGAASVGSPIYSGSAGNTPPVSPPQGNPGGTTNGPQNSNNLAGSGGGGAGASGSNVPAAGQPAGNGGVGSFVSPSFAVGCAGTPGPAPGVRYFAGGGGGGLQTDNSSVPSPGGIEGGAGGGGPGVRVAGAPPAPTPFNGTAGTTNTGGGGGAGGRYDNGKGAAGGSGIVIIRYKFQ